MYWKCNFLVPSLRLLPAFVPSRSLKAALLLDSQTGQNERRSHQAHPLGVLAFLDWPLGHGASSRVEG